MYRPPGSQTVYAVDLARVSDLMAGILQEGVAGVLLVNGVVVAKSLSTGRIGDVSADELTRLFSTPREPNRVIDEAPALRVMERDDDEPIFISSEPIRLATGRFDISGQPNLRVGFATTPSAVNVALSQIGTASLVAVGFVALAVLLAILIARWITARVTSLRDTLLDIAALELEAPSLPAMPSRELSQIREALQTALISLRTFSLFVPRELVLRLMALADGGTRIADKRTVTILFTDIAGFTSLASQMEPEGVTALLDDHFAMITTIVEEEGGVIGKFTGDGVMAYWGAPEATCNHATRGLAAVMRIQAAHEGSKASFGLRMGLHSGPVVAGTVGTATRLEYTVMGDTVNVASRLEQLGRDLAPDASCCALASANTCELVDTKEAQALHPLGQHALRGRRETIGVYRV